MAVRAAIGLPATAGRGRGKGTFRAVAAKASAHSPHEAANAKQIPMRLDLVAFIQPRIYRFPAALIRTRAAKIWPTRPILLMNDTENFMGRHTT